ncbi:MAG: DNA gyrase subunit A [Candidatus Acididesulfobacter diazotrophicus]|uniref:DNA gyrase subunit A n=1 Tax=Candidatus Acididesulfobacter diazotrophicus TaxID=2597226 RepID=A0A519BPY2_9DELT|nr:MAG: DNA gyrase subunit A [Candidatus Acididesulfobacter diazotrophicus]
MEQKNIININIEDEMRQSYLDYAMSVIIGRALPEIKDGLKPVHRRILFAMNEIGNDYNKPYKKSARIVGDVIGKYHPHGDSAVYDSIVRMAQDISLRYPLVDGQGNFGSIDGDPPAAMRYTEIRMTRLSSFMLDDIDNETVDFIPNYDGSLKEPTVLPAKFPNLLINGSSGIAVGMASNIPPHNLSETIDALLYFMDNPDCLINDLMEFMKGPDFPTGGIVYGYSGIINYFNTGRGIVKVRAKYHTEKDKIIITEVPYMVNKAKILEKIAELVREKKIEGISDLRDESDREGLRVVIELKRDANETILMNKLFSHTQLEETFGVIMLAIVNNQPKVLNLKSVLSYFIDFRKEVVVKRTLFELKKAQARLHILEALRIAAQNIDEVIELIKMSASPKEAKAALIKKYIFSEIQAQAILDMKLEKITNLEREQLIKEYEEILNKVNKLKEILANESLIAKIIKDELIFIKEKFGDARKTEIVVEETEVNEIDFIPNDEMIVMMTGSGYIKRTKLDSFQSQHRGGRGHIGIKSKEDDFVTDSFCAMAHDSILFLTNLGIAYKLKVYNIPETQKQSKGKPIVNLLNLRENEKISFFVPAENFNEGYSLVVATKKGQIIKTSLINFANVRKGGLIAVKLREGDEVINVKIVDNSLNDTLITIATKFGKSICSDINDYRLLARGAMGVRGIKLLKGDEVVSMDILTSKDDFLVGITENGYGKKTTMTEFRKQKRGGSGLIAIKTGNRNGNVVAVLKVKENNDIILITSSGRIIRIKASNLRSIGRNTMGVRLIGLSEGEKVSNAIAVLASNEGEEEITD